jgi:hypothetical protein
MYALWLREEGIFRSRATSLPSRTPACKLCSFPNGRVTEDVYPYFRLFGRDHNENNRRNKINWRILEWIASPGWRIVSIIDMKGDFISFSSSWLVILFWHATTGSEFRLKFRCFGRKYYLRPQDSRENWESKNAEIKLIYSSEFVYFLLSWLGCQYWRYQKPVCSSENREYSTRVQDREEGLVFNNPPHSLSVLIACIGPSSETII